MLGKFAQKVYQILTLSFQEKEIKRGFNQTDGNHIIKRSFERKI